MGGCKCTYRNCNVKTDGKTHMFHYPVFEKIRCHQWLINAHRLDFLNLKVSQLKNRVVCQHHFKDDNFMNFKKDKLTFDAIPTEDGPYCDPKNYVYTPNESSKLYSIIVDDIENDLYGGDKRANFSMKYGDFLTNFDFPELGNEANISYKSNNCVNNSPIDENNKDKVIDESSVFYRLFLTEKNATRAQNQPMLVVPPYVNSSNISQSDSNKSLKCENNLSLNSVKDSKNSKGEINVKNQAVKDDSAQKQNKKRTGIRIISEKKITEPVPITGKFEPVSPNFVLNISKPKENTTVTSKNDSTKNVTDLKLPNLDETQKIEIEICIDENEKSQPTQCIDENEKSQPTQCIDENEKSQPAHSANLVQDNNEAKKPDNNEAKKPMKTFLSHPKIPPERVKAINKKRKFNMKLREVIESCLDKLENADKGAESLEKYEYKKSNQTAISPSNELPVSDSQKYTIQFLEARMTKMENNLLKKIEENAKKIVDLKSACIKAETKSNALSRYDEEAHKKQLFQDISKYLSPSSKSLVYEELFINKYSLNDSISNKFALNESSSSVKRKRGRRFS